MSLLQYEQVAKACPLFIEDGIAGRGQQPTAGRWNSRRYYRATVPRPAAWASVHLAGMVGISHRSSAPATPRRQRSGVLRHDNPGTGEVGAEPFAQARHLRRHLDPAADLAGRQRKDTDAQGDHRLIRPDGQGCSAASGAK